MGSLQEAKAHLIPIMHIQVSMLPIMKRKLTPWLAEPW